MKFTSKAEAYLYSIYMLKSMLAESVSPSSRAAIEAAINSIKICVENHEQYPNIVSDILDCLTPSIDPKNRLILTLLSRALSENSYEQTDAEKWRAPLARRFESQIQIALLENPTKGMMAAVKKVSDTLLDILSNEKSWFKNAFSYLLEEGAHIIAFGSFEETPSFSTIKKILSSNKSDQLAEIMHMHYKFAQNFSRKLTGRHATESAEITSIADTKMYGSAYYKERGRLTQALYNGFDPTKTSNQMGLLVDENDICAIGLPCHRSSWVPDAKAQTPNLTSPYVQSLISYDIPYVAGPSGMVSLFIAQAIGFNVLTTTSEKQSYAAAIAAYMVSGGFHSLHEVLGPLAICLPEQNLVPGYEASPTADIRARKAKPPNFHAFYSNMAAIDSQFSAVLDAGWNKLNAFMKDLYIAKAKLPSYETVLKNRLLEGISAYNGNTINGMSIVKSLNSTSATHYKKLMAGAETDFERMVITYALLATKNAGGLQQNISSALGFSDAEEAKQHIEAMIKDHIKTSSGASRLAEFVDEVITSLQEQVIDKIVKLAIEKPSKNKFVDPLLELQTIEIALQPKEVATKVLVI
ncbi:MAG: hypothetical protein Q8L78_08500 [Coxiellaceae bacterium]|nr:hypothetical protein [Coxiellaceae bacterium]